jgi:hypothetical protein
MYSLFKCQSNGTLRANSSKIAFDVSTGLIKFNDLYITGFGSYILNANIKTKNSEYELVCLSKLIIVTKSGQVLTNQTELPPNLIFT